MLLSFYVGKGSGSILELLAKLAFLLERTSFDPGLDAFHYSKLIVARVPGDFFARLQVSANRQGLRDLSSLNLKPLTKSPAPCNRLLETAIFGQGSRENGNTFESGLGTVAVIQRFEVEFEPNVSNNVDPVCTAVLLHRFGEFTCCRNGQTRKLAEKA